MRSINYLGAYIPTRFRYASQGEISYRNFILDFKQGRVQSARKAAEMISSAICNNFDQFRTHLICTPAANQADYFKRYSLFAEIVCSLTGMQNDLHAVHYFGQRLAIHKLEDRGEGKNISVMTCCDIDIIPGDRYIIFDDVYTRGKTFNALADYIEGRGGKVGGGYFLGRTFWR